MPAYIEERWSSSAWWCRRVARFGLLLAVVALVVHRIGLIDTWSLFWVMAVVVGLAMLALLLAAAAFQRIWYLGDRGGKDLALGTLTACLTLAPFGLLLYWTLSTVVLNQVSTDLDDPPPLTAAAKMNDQHVNRIGPISEAEKQLQAAEYPAVTGRRFPLPAEQVTTAIELMLAERGWETVRPMSNESEVEYIAESIYRLPVVAIPFDVTIRITDEGSGAYVDMRSASLYGDRDLGFNAWLVDDFLTDLDSRAGALAGVVPQS